MTVIALLTDFGLADTYVGEMKAVVAGIAPHAQVVDLCHHTPPQEVLAGAIMLADSADSFPPGSIFTAVVDPGVGTDRRAVAVQTERYTFVGPDNGLFTAVLRRHEPLAAVLLDEARYHFRRPGESGSSTFHGRDVFSPAAAHLAAGTALMELGTTIDPGTLLQLAIPEPTEQDDELHGQVLRVDHFGNLITNITQISLSDSNSVASIRVGDCEVGALRQTFSDVAVGDAVAYLGSHGRLEIAVRDGNAAKVLAAQAGDRVVVR